MKIGVPTEIKTGETRVAMTPNLCRRCVKLGATVMVQKGAGASSGFTDPEYRKAGAKIVNAAAKVWGDADMVVKVKEPQASEFKYFRPDLTLFTYLHLAACPELTAALVKKQVLGIAYESVESRDGYLPLLKPMSHIAGRLSIQTGAYFLQSQNGGSGVLLGGIPGTMPGRVAIVGAGNSGAHACRMAIGMGARVAILDLDPRKLEVIDDEYRGGVVTLMANPGNVEMAVADCDLLIGAVAGAERQGADRSHGINGQTDATGERHCGYRDRPRWLRRHDRAHQPPQTHLCETWGVALCRAQHARARRSHLDARTDSSYRALFGAHDFPWHRTGAAGTRWIGQGHQYASRRSREC